jgi:nickel/cobalt transporter (NiCoT) family protein
MVRRPLLGLDVGEAARRFEQAGVIGLATWTALKMDRRAGEHTGRILAGQLQLDVGVEDFLACGATRVSVLGAQKLVEATKIGHQAASFSRSGCPAAAMLARRLCLASNTTRKLLQDGKRPLGVGFFFSLGHSTIVFSLAAGLAIAATTVNSKIPSLQDSGGSIGASVSGTFLLLIGILNLVVLLDILGVFKHMRRGRYDEQTLEDVLQKQGLMSRFFLKRVGDRIDASWKLYPLGVLFGLGFDTATEVGLLALAGGVATHEVPFLAVISLPLIFAAGMSLMDTADGAFMSHAYGWAFANPIRKVYYNITVTSLSVAVALIVGTIELLQVTAARFSLEGGFWNFLDGLDFSRIGYAVVALFVATWALSVALWKVCRIEARWGSMIQRG